MSSAGDDDGANIELGATFLLTTTSTSRNSKYSKIWRRTSLNISFLISLKKSTSANESPPPSPLSSVPYTSLSPSEPPARTSSSKSCVEIDVEEGEEDAEEGHIRNDIARIVKEKDLKSLNDLGGVNRVCDVLHGQRRHSESEVSTCIYNWDNGLFFNN